MRSEGGYLVPRGDGRYVLGATIEERGFDTSITAGAVHDLLRDAAELVPGVLELELEEALAGLRPGTPDNAPAIGPGPLEGLHWATGHYRNGILLAPLTAEAVIAGVLGEAACRGAAPFSPLRFAVGRRARGRRMTVTVHVNGQPRELAPGTTVAAVVASLGAERATRGVAVAVDAEVVPRTQWERASCRAARAWRSSPRFREAEGMAIQPTDRERVRDEPLTIAGQTFARGCCSARAGSPRWRRSPRRSRPAGPSW